jgi:hypothetical protein
VLCTSSSLQKHERVTKPPSDDDGKVHHHKEQAKRSEAAKYRPILRYRCLGGWVSFSRDGVWVVWDTVRKKEGRSFLFEETERGIMGGQGSTWMCLDYRPFLF